MKYKNQQTKVKFIIKIEIYIFLFFIYFIVSVKAIDNKIQIKDLSPDFDAISKNSASNEFTVSEDNKYNFNEKTVQDSKNIPTLVNEFDHNNTSQDFLPKKNINIKDIRTGIALIQETIKNMNMKTETKTKYELFNYQEYGVIGNKPEPITPKVIGFDPTAQKEIKNEPIEDEKKKKQQELKLKQEREEELNKRLFELYPTQKHLREYQKNDLKQMKQRENIIKTEKGKTSNSDIKPPEKSFFMFVETKNLHKDTGISNRSRKNLKKLHNI